MAYILMEIQTTDGTTAVLPRPFTQIGKKQRAHIIPNLLTLHRANVMSMRYRFWTSMDVR